MMVSSPPTLSISLPLPLPFSLSLPPPLSPSPPLSLPLPPPSPHLHLSLPLPFPISTSLSLSLLPFPPPSPPLPPPSHYFSFSLQVDLEQSIVYGSKSIVMKNVDKVIDIYTQSHTHTSGAFHLYVCFRLFSLYIHVYLPFSSSLFLSLLLSSSAFRFLA